MDDVHDPIDLGNAMGMMKRMRDKSDEPAPYACCPRDGEPLIATFEFRGAEFYCMACKGKFGFLAPRPQPPTPELLARHDELRAQYDKERAERKAKGE